MLSTQTFQSIYDIVVNAKNALGCLDEIIKAKNGDFNQTRNTEYQLLIFFQNCMYIVEFAILI